LPLYRHGNWYREEKEIALAASHTWTLQRTKIPQAMSCITIPEQEGQAAGLLVSLPDRCLASLIRRSLRSQVGRWTSFGRRTLAVVSAEIGYCGSCDVCKIRAAKQRLERLVIWCSASCMQAFRQPSTPVQDYKHISNNDRHMGKDQI
jgi:hypothetical protein